MLFTFAKLRKSGQDYKLVYSSATAFISLPLPFISRKSAVKFTRLNLVIDAQSCQDFGRKLSQLHFDFTTLLTPLNYDQESLC